MNHKNQLKASLVLRTRPSTKKYDEKNKNKTLEVRRRGGSPVEVQWAVGQFRLLERTQCFHDSNRSYNVSDFCF